MIRSVVFPEMEIDVGYFDGFGGYYVDPDHQSLVPMMVMSAATPAMDETMG